MVCVMRDESGHMVIGPITELACGDMAPVGGLLPGRAEWSDRSSSPQDVVRNLLAYAPETWKFPVLRGVVEIPVLRPDGTILEEPGYDRATQMYYAPAPELRVPPVPQQATAAQIDAALNLIYSIITDFPFVDDTSRANAVAAIITPQLLAAINASTPMVVLDATAAGTGKGLIAEVTALINTGRPADLLSAPNDPDEWRKRICNPSLNAVR